MDLPRRKLESELKWFEQIWSQLVECLGPDSERALLELKQQTVRELQQPSRKSLAFYRQLFGMSEKQLYAELPRYIVLPHPFGEPSDTTLILVRLLILN